MAALEGGAAAVATASGAAAVTYAVQNVALGGGHIVAAKNLYGGTYNLLAHTLTDYGITTTFVDPLRPEEFAKAIRENTKALYIEALGNPNSEVSDVETIAKIAHDHGIPLMIDATFATPYLLRPIEYGADIVIHSATKFIGGHGTSIGGVIIDSGRFDWKASGKFPQFTEPNPSYHGTELCGRGGQGGVCGADPRHPSKGYRRLSFPISRFPVLTGTGNAFPSGGASCGEHGKSH